MQPPARPVILFDGVCNLCNGFVQFVIKRDKEAKFLFAPLQSAVADELLEGFILKEEKMKSMVLFENGKPLQKSNAALRIITQLPWWGWMKVCYIFPLWLRDAVYEFISRNRYRVFGRREACMVPQAGWKERFL